MFDMKKIADVRIGDRKLVTMREPFVLSRLEHVHAGRATVHVGATQGNPAIYGALDMVFGRCTPSCDGKTCYESLSGGWESKLSCNAQYGVKAALTVGGGLLGWWAGGSALAAVVGLALGNVAGRYGTPYVAHAMGPAPAAAPAPAGQ